MTYEETKELLDSIRDKKKLLRSKQQYIEEFKAQITVASCNLSAPHGGEYIAPQQRYIERLEEMQEDFDRLLTKVMDAEDLLADVIKSLPEQEQSIIIDRFMNGKSWRKIQEQYRYAESQPYKIIKKAIKRKVDRQ